MDNFNLSVIENSKKEDIIYFAKKNDSLLSISEKFCIDKSQLANDNNLDVNYQVEEGDIIWVRRKNMATYVVKPLDTIEKIAIKFNVTAQHIKDINQINTVYLGQKIFI